MPHISKHKVDDRLMEKLYKNLSIYFAKPKSRDTASKFVDQILTDTEKIMIAKRIAIIWLLYKGVSQREISNVLKVSLSTVQRFKLRYERGRYNYMIASLAKRKSMFDEVDELLHLGYLLRPYGRRKGR